jgi:hypothetical protein
VVFWPTNARLKGKEGSSWLVLKGAWRMVRLLQGILDFQLTFSLVFCIPLQFTLNISSACKVSVHGFLLILNFFRLSNALIIRVSSRLVRVLLSAWLLILLERVIDCGQRPAIQIFGARLLAHRSAGSWSRKLLKIGHRNALSGLVLRAGAAKCVCMSVDHVFLVMLVL